MWAMALQPLVELVELVELRALHMAIVKTRFGISNKAQIPQGQPTWTFRPVKPMPGLLSRQLDGRARPSHLVIGLLGCDCVKP